LRLRIVVAVRGPEQDEQDEAVDLYVVERGPNAPDAPFVVLVHGVLDSSDSFDGVVERLPDMRVLTYDRRGYGRSLGRRSPRLTMRQHADDLLDLIGDRRAVVVGHSMGGNVAMVAAAIRPDVVASVAGYEVHAGWMDCWDPEVQAQMLVTAADPDSDAIGETSFRRSYGDARWEALSDEERDRRRAEGASFQADLASGWDTRFAFERAAVPTLVGCGERSVGFFVEATRRLARDLPATYVEVEGARHGVHITRPDAFADLVRRTVALASGGVGD
jgi:pimeloyl-ACP methyl ester carboxylesterase